MADILKTRQVDQDLVEIWLYTAEKWGEAQADKYLRKIETCFEKIKQEKIPLKFLTEKVQFVRCEHHLIFLYSGKKPVIIAVLHEKMDILVRLKKRLD